jgi:hypothetical protein
MIKMRGILYSLFLSPPLHWVERGNKFARQICWGEVNKSATALSRHSSSGLLLFYQEKRRGIKAE